MKATDLLRQDDGFIARLRGASEERSLVVGVFLANAQIADVCTRAGARITGSEAVVVPVLLRNPPLGR